MTLALCVMLCLLPCVALADIPDGWFGFVISEPAEGSIVDVSAYGPEPAGAHGFVTIQDGHFVDGAGERIRFLARNLTAWGGRAAVAIPLAWNDPAGEWTITARDVISGEEATRKARVSAQ